MTLTKHVLKLLAIIVLVFFIGLFLESSPYITDLLGVQSELLSDFFPVFVSFSIFAMTWYAYSKSRDNHSLFLGWAFLVIGVLELFHALSHPFLPDFITPNSPQKLTIFVGEMWLISALLFLTSAYIYRNTLPRLINRYVLFTSAIVLSFISLTTTLFYPDYLLLQYLRDTPFLLKFLLPITSVIILYASYLYSRRFQKTGQKNLVFLIYGLIIIVFSDLIYLSYDISAHLLRITAFFFVYIALHKSSVEMPYEKLLVEEKLRCAAEEKYRNLFDSASDAIITIDLEDRVTSWNKAAETIFGWKAEEVMGNKLSPLIVPPQLKADRQQIVRDVISGKPVSGVETVHLRRDGTEIDVSLTISPILNADNKIIGLSDIIRDITERKLMDKVVRESEKRYRCLVEGVRDVIFTLSLDGRITSLNPVFEAITGWSRNDWIGKPFATIINPDDLPVAMEMFQRVSHGEVCKVYELRVLSKSGEYLIGEFATTPVIKDERVVGVLGIARDITERKKAEETLERLNRQNKLILESMGEGIFGVDVQGKATFVNPTAASMLGYEVEELLGKSTHDLLHHSKPDGTPYPREECPIYAAFKDGTVHHVADEVFWRRDGTSFPVEYVSTPIIEREEIVGVVVVFNDITEQKRTEEAMKKLSSAVQQSADSVIITNKDDVIEYVNPAFEKLTGYTRVEVIGKTPNILKSGKHDKKFYRKLHETIHSRKVFRAEIINKKKNGEIYLVASTITPIKDMQGNITHFVSTEKDITEDKKAEEICRQNERLALASKTKSEFLATMSHELRTPLNSVIGFSELMKQKMAGELNGKQEHYLDNILTSSKHLLDLINDILDLSKVEAGKVELVIEKLSVLEIINESIVLIKEKATNHHVILKKELDSQLGFIEADGLRFKQVLFNLLSNAVKFSKLEGGTVTIIAKKEGDMAKFSVSDTGIGIKEEDMGKLFDKFQQIDSSISRKYGGTGLGLAITKQLVEMHGGKIMAESKFGEGSTFTFLLPLIAGGED